MDEAISAGNETFSSEVLQLDAITALSDTEFWSVDLRGAANGPLPWSLGAGQAVEIAVGRRRRVGLIGAQDRNLQIGEQRGAGLGQRDAHLPRRRYRAAADRAHHRAVWAAELRIRERLEGGADVARVQGATAVESQIFPQR